MFKETACFSNKRATDSVFLLMKRMVFLSKYTFEHKGQLSFFERGITSLKDTLHVLKQ